MAELKVKNDKAVLNDLQGQLMQLQDEEAFSKLQSVIHDRNHTLSFQSLNDETEKSILEEIKFKKTYIDSINTKAEELKTLLKSEDVSLGEETWKQIDSIAELAVKLNVEDLDLTNFLLAYSSMKNEKFKTEEQRMMNCVMMSSYSQQSLKINKSNGILKSQLDALKEVIDAQDSNKVKIAGNINFFTTKNAEYECNIKQKKDRLKDNKFEESLQHSSLVEWSEAIRVLEEKLKESKEKLKNYKCLAPNENLAKLKIEEKKEELKQLENEFMSLLNKWENRNDNNNTCVEKM